ncbi:hypothetical protein BGZ76_011218 [Entomortierella beljakovae]|nr:hypothetical protein BGZ76_011218 [Entomortierella beljakovae]
MPTYAPVPLSFSNLSHRAQALLLYRRTLRQGAKFFDERASLWIKTRAQEAFRKSKPLRDNVRIEKCMSDARKASLALRLVERANQMDFKAVMRVLRLSYGMQGKERQKLLKPYLDSARARTLSPEKLSDAITTSGNTIQYETPPNHEELDIPKHGKIPTYQISASLSQLKKTPQPLHYSNKRTIPPILSPPLVSLIKDSGKSPEPILPVPLFKPLHGKREANLRWRYFTKQVRKVTPPLPTEIREEMERKSLVGLRDGLKQNDGVPDHLFDSNWSIWEQQILDTIRAWNKNGQDKKENRWATGAFHPSIGGKPAKPSVLTPRLYRRIWQHLLDDVPILDVHFKVPSSKGNDISLIIGQTPTPSYSVSRSHLSYQARQTAGLGIKSRVNSFDMIGMDENAIQQSSLPPKSGRK